MRSAGRIVWSRRWPMHIGTMLVAGVLSSGSYAYGSIKLLGHTSYARASILTAVGGGTDRTHGWHPVGEPFLLSPVLYKPSLPILHFPLPFLSFPLHVVFLFLFCSFRLSTSSLWSLPGFDHYSAIALSFSLIQSFVYSAIRCSFEPYTSLSSCCLAL